MSFSTLMLERSHSLGKYATSQAKTQSLASITTLLNKNRLGLNRPLLLLKRSRLAVSTAKTEPAVTVKPRPTETEKLENMVSGSHNSLLSATTVFPFVLFPSTIHIDRQKFTIVHRKTFRSATTSSVSLNDIQNVEVKVGPLFGSLILTSKFFQTNTQSINYLHRNDVIKIQQLLQGYMIAKHSGIDISSVESPQLIKLLNDLGGSSI